MSSFKELRQKSEFEDVSLICEDDYQIEAPRILLTARSPFFSTVLRRNKHPHPIIYMRGLKARDLGAVVDFIYHGEANIYQEHLDRFLAMAEELQLKGLVGSKTDSNTDQEDTNTATGETEKMPIQKSINKMREKPSNDTLQHRDRWGETVL